MEKSIIEQTNSDGLTTRYTEERPEIPMKYVAGAALGALGLVLLFRGKGNKNKPSFFRQYITPLIIAAVYKKVAEAVENKFKAPPTLPASKMGSHVEPAPVSYL